jgi:hypothetical protein
LQLKRTYADRPSETMDFVWESILTPWSWRSRSDEADLESPCGLCRHDQWLTMVLPCNSREHQWIAGPPSCNKIMDFEIV